ncbi:MAG TPA: discoidin domain-containing protein, partial [Polyangiaceae bacterium]|nr:discoidin domain-containing protein [Polyangiaceae bacterium]
GKRLQKAQLDDQGARPIPEICMTCHGGVWDPQSRAANGLTIPAIGSYWGIARFARFLPLVTSTVTFTGSPPYTLAEQEPAIMAVNQAAWRARGTALTERQKHLMIWLYSPTTNGDSVSGLVARRTAMMQDTLSFSSSSPNAQWAANAWPGDWGASIPLYNGVVLPYCDTCHLAMDPSSSWHDMNGAAIPGGGRNPQWGLAYNWLDSRFTSRDHVDTLAGQMGVNIGSGTWNTDRTQFAMPHAENAFARFWGDKSGAGGFTCTLAGNVFPPADCLLADLGIWPLSGRAAPKSATNPSGIDYQSVRPSTERDCGQSSTSSSSTVGANAGRRLAGVALPAPLTSTFVNQCADGCTTVMFCPGAETVYDSNKFPGARQECVPNTLSYGSCVSCGRIGEPACAQVGPTCNTNLNPSCQNLPACHEGVKGASGLCETSDLTRNGWATASQSSWNQYYPASRAIDGNYSGWWNDNSVTHTDYTTDTQPWWKVDLAWTRKVKFINLYNRSDCCSNRLGNFVVEYSTDNTNWTLVPGADFTGVFPTNASYIPLVIPKAIDARYIRVRHLLGGPPGENFSIISLAEVSVLGWN